MDIDAVVDWANQNWISLIFSILMVLLAIFVGGKLLYGFLCRIARGAPTRFDDEFIDAIKSEIHLLVIVLGFQIATLT